MGKEVPKWYVNWFSSIGTENHGRNSIKRSRYVGKSRRDFYYRHIAVIKGVEIASL